MEQTNELYHYGKLGMRWGQRKNGGTSNTKGNAPTKVRERSDDYAKVSTLRKKHTSELSNADLETITKRLTLEKQYRDIKPTQASKGKTYIDKIVKAGAVVAGVSTTALTINKNSQEIRKILKKVKPTV